MITGLWQPKLSSCPDPRKEPRSRTPRPNFGPWYTYGKDYRTSRWIYSFLDIYISISMDPIVALGLIIRALKWIYFWDPPRDVGKQRRRSAKSQISLETFRSLGAAVKQSRLSNLPIRVLVIEENTTLKAYWAF